MLVCSSSSPSSSSSPLLCRGICASSSIFISTISLPESLLLLLTGLVLAASMSRGASRDPLVRLPFFKGISVTKCLQGGFESTDFLDLIKGLTGLGLFLEGREICWWCCDSGDCKEEVLEGWFSSAREASMLFPSDLEGESDEQPPTLGLSENNE